MKDSQVVVHLKVDRAILRELDVYAALNDMYRNEAVVVLIKKGLEGQAQTLRASGGAVGEETK